MRIDLIASSFNSDIYWLNNMESIDNIFLYEKSDNNIPLSNLSLITKKLINIGCEHQSYLQHIVDNYNYLADINIFIQGYPFDHLLISKEDFFDLVRNKNYCVLESGYIDIMSYFMSMDEYGRRILAPGEDKFKLDCVSFANKFEITLPSLFQSNGIFGATRDCIHSISREKWNGMNEHIKQDCTSILPDGSRLYLWANCSVYIMERMWFSLLNNGNNLPENYKINKERHLYGPIRSV